MICSLNYADPYFTIENVLRKERLRYAFIGEMDINNKSIYEKLEQKIKPNDDELDYLKKKYKTSYKSWIELNSATKLFFINDSINMTDTLEEVKNKICTYLSRDNIILPNNQQIWYTTKEKKYKVIGTIFEKHKNIPIIVQYKDKSKFLKDKNKFIISNGGKIKKKKNKIINENNYMLYDLIDNITENHLLYMSDLMNEVYYLNNKKIKIKKDLIYGYLNKYWIKGTIIEKKKKHRR